MTKAQKQEQQEAIAELKTYVKKGDTLYTVLKHVSQSGMSRRISVKAIKNNEPRHLDWLVSKALDRRLSDKEGIVVSGCGMDMGFELVYSLAYTLFGDGYALRQEWI